MNNKDIEEMARKICFRSGVHDTCKKCLEYNYASRCNYKECAETFYDAGYRKITWHKVADGDLPKQEDKDHIATPVQVYYKNELGMLCTNFCYFFFIDNTFRSLNSNKTLSVIVWTEMQKYEGDKDVTV